MKNMLQKDGRFHYSLTPPSKPMSEEERMAHQQVMSIINNNTKKNALKLLQRYRNPHECWIGLKAIYEFEMLIEILFALRKKKSISMNTHLTKVCGVANLLEEVDVNIPENIIIYCTLKNFPKECEIFKRMQMDPTIFQPTNNWRPSSFMRKRQYDWKLSKRRW